MRIVVADVGNTSTAVGFFSDGRVSCVSHHDDDFEGAFAAVRAIASRRRPEALAYASVVPRKDARWRRLAKELKLPIVVISSRMFDSSSPVRLAVPHPESIGADRLCDAYAAVVRHGVPAVVCGFGTAFTAAAIDAKGRWLGGAIAPGPAMMLDVLHEKTAKLPRIAPGGRVRAIVRDTEDEMRLGVVVGYRGMVESVVAAVSRRLGAGCRLVAAGGYASRALAGTSLPFEIDPDLTLLGCALLAERELERTGK